MLFGKLLPREGNFFEMFNQHADKIVEAARAFSQLVTHYNDPHILAKVSRGLGEPMTGIGMDEVTVRLSERGW